MRKVAHRIGHLLWWLAYQIDPKGTPVYTHCHCRDDPVKYHPGDLAEDGDW